MNTRLNAQLKALSDVSAWHLFDSYIIPHCGLYSVRRYKLMIYYYHIPIEAKLPLGMRLVTCTV